MVSADYILYSPLSYSNAYLIDKEGEVIHIWKCESPPYYSAYLMESTALLRSVFGKIQKIAWNGNVLWEYENNDMHHDIELLPNGHILCIAYDDMNHTEALNAGRNPDLIASYGVQSEKIIEINSNGQIVWEWRARDHLIQDYDSSKSNYGDVSAHKELIDFNYVDSLFEVTGSADFIHLNAVDYHPGLDLILLTARHYDEVWVIDHSVTTEEARGSMGDLIYRWGNPETYRGSGPQIMFHPHDGQWVEGGNIIYFNNKYSLTHSSVEEFTPSYVLGVESPPVWRYICPFRSAHLGSVQRLPNGNTLICSGEGGRLIEVTPDKNIVFDFINPYYSKVNYIFKAIEYSENYPGLKMLTNKNPNNPVEPEGPQNVELFTTVSFSTSTTDPDGDRVLYMFDWGDGTESSWLGPIDSGEVITAVNNWDNVGKFYVRVKAKDVYGGESGWSFGKFVNVSYSNNTPPGKPYVSGISRGNVSVSYNFSVLSNDSDDLFYMWDFGDGTQTDWIGPYISGEICMINHSWSNRGTFYVKALAKDEYGSQSEWSDPLTVYIDNFEPDKPIVNGPNMGAAGRNYMYSMSSFDNENDNIYFFIDWGDETNSSWIGPFESGEICEVSHVWSEKGTYEIKVKAKDVHGAESVWSDPFVVSMPKNKGYLFLWFHWFLESHPRLFPIMRQILKI